MGSIVVDRASLLTREEAAEYLSVKPNTLAIWAMSGRGPALVKLNNRTVRYEMKALVDYVRANTIGGEVSE